MYNGSYSACVCSSGGGGGGGGGGGDVCVLCVECTNDISIGYSLFCGNTSVFA